MNLLIETHQSSFEWLTLVQSLLPKDALLAHDPKTLPFPSQQSEDATHLPTLNIPPPFVKTEASVEDQYKETLRCFNAVTTRLNFFKLCHEHSRFFFKFSWPFFSAYPPNLFPLAHNISLIPPSVFWNIPDLPANLSAVAAVHSFLLDPLAAAQSSPTPA